MKRRSFFGFAGRLHASSQCSCDAVRSRTRRRARCSPSRRSQRSETSSAFELICRLARTAAPLVSFVGASVLVRWQAHHVRLGRVHAKRHSRKTPQWDCERNNLAPAAPRLIPTCAGNFNGLSPNVIEAFDRYSELFLAGFRKLGSRPARAIRRSLHFLQQEAVAVAFRRVFWEWP
jgi:hypothetical protein